MLGDRLRILGMNNQRPLLQHPSLKRSSQQLTIQLQPKQQQNAKIITSRNDIIACNIKTQQGFSEVKQYLENNPKFVKLKLKLAKGTRQIPEDFFVGLTRLKWLDLNNNQLANLPDSIGNLTSLERLDLNKNQLTNLPDSIGNLRRLKWLYLNQNQLTNIPDLIGNLRSLKRLYLNQNQLTNLPESLPEALRQRMRGGQLKIWGMNDQSSLLQHPLLKRLSQQLTIQLQPKQQQNATIRVSRNDIIACNIKTQQGFSEVKQYLENNPKFVKLKLKLAEGAGQIPEDFFVGLTRLKGLKLYGTQLTNLPDSIGNLTNLQKLYLNQNQLINRPESLPEVLRQRMQGGQLRIFGMNNQSPYLFQEVIRTSIEEDILDKLDKMKEVGHTLKKHVGQSNKELIRICTTNFTDKLTAINAIKENLRNNVDKIAKWLKSEIEDKKVLKFTHLHSIGKGVPKHKNIIIYNLKKSRVVLKKDPNYELGFKVLTSYPRRF